jgi:hypothetical protein
MALTVTNINPTAGLTAGREFILITGTDFNTAVDAQGASRMEVKFGSALARRVRVRSATELDCLNPIGNPGIVSVTLTNLDTTETVTVPTAFTYSRPVIGGAAANAGLVHVVQSLIAEMQRQIIEEVVLTTQTDYDDQVSDELNIVKLAKLPSIVLVGPDVSGSGGPHARTVEPLKYIGSGKYEEPRPLDPVDLLFRLHGVDDHQSRMLNLLEVVIWFFRRNPVLSVLSDPSDPNSPIYDIDMRPPQPQDWATNTTPNIHNLKHFSGAFKLVGVPIGRDDIILTTQGGNEGDNIDLDFVLQQTDPL